MTRMIAIAGVVGLVGAATGCVPAPGYQLNEDTFVIFHNNSGPMCLDALAWLNSAKESCPSLLVEEHLTYQSGEQAILDKLVAQFGQSKGVSTQFEYLPIIFFKGQAYSGFNEEIKTELEEKMPGSEGC